MYTLLLLACPELFWPHVDALNRFPCFSTACQQIARCEAHLAVLSDARRLHGHCGGLWEQATAQTRWRLDYWRQLSLCHLADRWQPEGDVRRLLEALRGRIGAERFLAGWRPPLLPSPPEHVKPVNAAGH